LVIPYCLVVVITVLFNNVFEALNLFLPKHCKMPIRVTALAFELPSPVKIREKRVTARIIV
jgi:hypothetical protein